MQEVAEEGEFSAWAPEGEEATPLISNRIIYGSPPLANMTPSTSSLLSSNTCSSAVTPRFSNVTIDDDEMRNDPPPRVPSMTSTSSHPSGGRRVRTPSRVPPPRKSNVLRHAINGSSVGSNDNHHNRPPHRVALSSSHQSTRSSRIKTSTTLVILLLGLFLAICTLVQYFVMGPNSFDLPPDLDSNGNDGTIGEDGGVKNNGAISGGGGRGKRGKKTHNEGVLFDEFGRYIIEDYDANPPFSDILPVSCKVVAN